MNATLARVAEAVRPLAADALRPARAQLSAVAGQALAGALNLVFLLVAARIVSPLSFPDLAAFMSVYLLMHVFVGSLGPSSALRPDESRALSQRLFLAGVGVMIAAVVLSDALAAVVGIPAPLVLALGVSAPAAGVLAVERGRLYGRARYANVVLSLLAEPVVRLSLGVILALALGVRGAALGVVAGGWAALAVVEPSRLGPWWARVVGRLQVVGTATRQVPARIIGTSASTRSAALSFVALAVVLHQDLLLANRVLPPGEATRFAVVSTLGGLAAFATTTIPLVLIGQERSRAALRTAVVAAAMVGGLAAVVVGIVPGLFVRLLFGAGYAGASGLAFPYLVAMTMYSVARVLAAAAVTGPQARAVPRIAGAVAVLQAGAILFGPRDAVWIVAVTFMAAGSALAALAVLHVGISATLRLWSIPRLRSIPSLGWSLPRGGSSGLPALPEVPAVLSELRSRAVTAAASAGARATALARRPDFWTVAALTVAALALRTIAPRSLWLDEAISAVQARTGFRHMLELLKVDDVHPPLHASVLWVTTRLAGSSEFALRLPSMIAGALAVPLLYAIGREAFDRRTGVVASLLGTVAPFLVWYSQEARMYALYMLFALAATLGLLRAVRRGQTADWILYAASTAVLLWTHYFAVLLVLVQQFVFLFAALERRGPARRRHVVSWATAMAGVVLACVPLMPFFVDQLLAYAERRAVLSDLPAQAGDVSAASSKLTVYAVIANLVWGAAGYHDNDVMAQINAFWPFGMLLLLALLGRKAGRQTRILVALTVIPIVLLAGIGLLRRDLFEIRYVAGVVPVLVVLVARMLTGTLAGRRVQIAFTAVALAGFCGALVDQQVNRTNPRIYDFRGALDAVQDLARPADVVVYEPYYLEPVVTYYAPGLRTRRLSGSIPRSGRVIVVGSFLDKPDVAARTGWLLSKLEQTRGIPREFERSRVKVWVYG